MHPDSNLYDFTLRTESTTPPEVAEDPNELPDMTTPEEMYGGVIGHRAPPVPEPGDVDA